MDIQYEIVSAQNLGDADWDKITELTHASFQEHAERGLTMLNVACSADFLKKRCLDGTLILASYNEQPVGYYCYAIQSCDNKKVFKGITMAVHPQFKRKGISRQLHAHAREQAEQSRCAYGILDTSCDAPSARAAHRAVGYKDWYYTHFSNANYYSIVMRLDLKEEISTKSRYKALVFSWLKQHLTMNKNGRLRLLYRAWLKLVSCLPPYHNLPIAKSNQLKAINLQKTQQINFNLLKVFSDFCDKHGLRYLLCYGTLIGAVRHNGFIPWDDDVDVTMPVPDYYKFRELFEKENTDPQYALLYGMKYNVGIPYTMLGDMRTLANMPGRDRGHSRPVAIDILPCYALSDDDDEAKAQIKDIATYTHLTWQYLNIKNIRLRKRFIYRFLFNNRKLASILPRIEDITRRYDWGNTQRVRTMAFIHTAFTWLKPEDFDDYILQPFEQGAFRIPRSYHNLLTAMYGNYMALPPEDKRKPNYSSSYIIEESEE